MKVLCTQVLILLASTSWARTIPGISLPEAVCEATAIFQGSYRELEIPKYFEAQYFESKNAITFGIAKFTIETTIKPHPYLGKDSTTLLLQSGCRGSFCFGDQPAKDLLGKKGIWIVGARSQISGHYHLTGPTQMPIAPAKLYEVERALRQCSGPLIQDLD